MSDFTEIKEFISHKGKSNSCYTIYFVKWKYDEVITELKKILDNINKKIKDNYKKKMSNDIIYSLVSYIEENFKPDNLISRIFLVNDKQINDFLLRKEQLKIAQEWYIESSYLQYDDHYHVDYLLKLFNNEKIYNVLSIDNKIAQNMEITETKYRIIFNKDISLVEPSSKYDLVYGISSQLKNFNGIKGEFTKTQILQKIKEKQLIENHKELDKILSNITNPKWQHKLVFGKKDISKSLEYCEIETLFCSSKHFEKIKQNISINFKVIIIDKIIDGDIGHQFKKDYSGLLGIKYY